MVLRTQLSYLWRLVAGGARREEAAAGSVPRVTTPRPPFPRLLSFLYYSATCVAGYWVSLIKNRRLSRNAAQDAQGRCCRPSCQWHGLKRCLDSCSAEVVSSVCILCHHEGILYSYTMQIRERAAAAALEPC